jgi:hypothetical protein
MKMELTLENAVAYVQQAEEGWNDYHHEGVVNAYEHVLDGVNMVRVVTTGRYVYIDQAPLTTWDVWVDVDGQLYGEC